MVLNQITTSDIIAPHTDATISSSPMPPTTYNEQDQTETSDFSKFYTLTILTGKLYAAKPPESDTRFIIITPDSEERDEDGDIMNRGILLNRSTSQIFNREFKETIFERDRLKIGIRVRNGSTLEQYLAAGYGLLKNPNKLLGMSISPV